VSFLIRRLGRRGCVCPCFSLSLLRIDPHLKPHTSNPEQEMQEEEGGKASAWREAVV
jgi:hypothetical protein